MEFADFGFVTNPDGTETHVQIVEVLPDSFRVEEIGTWVESQIPKNQIRPETADEVEERQVAEAEAEYDRIMERLGWAQ